MTVTFKKHSRGWRWHLVGQLGAINHRATRSFRTKYFCRRDFAERYISLQETRPLWPDLKDVTIS